MKRVLSITVCAYRELCISECKPHMTAYSVSRDCEALDASKQLRL